MPSVCRRCLSYSTLPTNHIIFAWIRLQPNLARFLTVLYQAKEIVPNRKALARAKMWLVPTACVLTQTIVGWRRVMVRRTITSKRPAFLMSGFSRDI